LKFEQVPFENQTVSCNTGVFSLNFPEKLAMEEERAVKFTLLALPADAVCDLLSIGVRIQEPELFTLFTTIYAYTFFKLLQLLTN